MTPFRPNAGALVVHLVGLALITAVVVGGYWVWASIDGWVADWARESRASIRENIPQGPDRRAALADVRDTQRFIVEYRLVAEIVVAFFALSVIDWIWRKTLGRLGPQPH